MPLHKGLDGFMSEEQFKTFYWPTLREMMITFINEGLVPCPLWEGKCDSRLEIIKDIPPGKAIYHFEQTDLFKAKEVLGNTVCIRGGVPTSILCTGTPEDVKTHCKKIIDGVGKGGGFIMDGPIGIPDETRPENMKAFEEATKEYGVY
jgi:uroporphyrinogen-III decarboxylase